MKKNDILLSIFLIFSTLGLNAQDGNLEINQDAKIIQLLEHKKTLNTKENLTNRYKIQIYSGDSRTAAENARLLFSNNFAYQPTSLEYNAPDYKIWVGSFRTRIEADRAYEKIKKKFATAIIFIPRKKNN